jgi:translocator protein
MKSVLQFIFALVLTQGAGIIGSFATMPAIESWYRTLVMPQYITPPNWVFGPVWITLYTLMAFALVLLWQSRSKHAKQLSFVFLVHLVVNACWSIVFFGMHAIGAALIILLVLWGMIIYIMYRSWCIDRHVTYLLAPYIAWVSFAGVLNAALWYLN